MAKANILNTRTINYLELIGRATVKSGVWQS